MWINNSVFKNIFSTVSCMLFSYYAIFSANEDKFLKLWYWSSVVAGVWEAPWNFLDQSVIFLDTGPGTVCLQLMRHRANYSEALRRVTVPIRTFLISLNSFYLLIEGVVDHCCTWSHSVTYTHSVGLLWTSDQPVAGTSTRLHTTFTRDSHPCSQRDSNPQSQQVNSCRPKP